MSVRRELAGLRKQLQDSRDYRQKLQVSLTDVAKSKAKIAYDTARVDQRARLDLTAAEMQEVARRQHDRADLLDERARKIRDLVEREDQRIADLEQQIDDLEQQVRADFSR